jgi:Ca2+-binding RTX toxin-like protein
VGGVGNDKLFGSAGRDLLIGSLGLDLLFGEAQDDTLVAGSTSYDEDEAALLAILAEWTSTNSYIARVNNIRLGGGANGTITLDSGTVADDGASDTLWGNGSLDWFLFGVGDKLKDKAINELVN